MTRRKLSPPPADRQITFHELLLAARQTWMKEALSEVLGEVDPNVLKKQLSTYVPADVQKVLASQGIRDEFVFPTPVVLKKKPTLVGYYRLLTGVGQKSFYRGHTGMSPFRKMENEGLLTESTKEIIDDFCKAMSLVLADLIRGIASALSSRDIHELQLLTLGSNFYGSANNKIGQKATEGVLEAIADVVKEYVGKRTGRTLSVLHPSGRRFTVKIASDPDVAVKEVVNNKQIRLLAIEIKGGSDAANVYNRGGEAEKSHQAAKEQEYKECWTIIRTSGIDLEKLHRGSPSTDQWFDTAQILAQKGKDWETFRQSLLRLFTL